MTPKVTQEAAYWKLPSITQGVSHLPVSEIDFTSVTTKKKRLDCSIKSGVTTDTPGRRQVRQVLQPTEEIGTFLEKLSVSGVRSVLLSVIPGHSTSFKPTLLTGDFFAILTELSLTACYFQTRLPGAKN